MPWVFSVAVLLTAAATAGVPPSSPAPRAGDAYMLTRISESASRDSDHGSGSSYDRDAVVERVLAVRETGVELEYDLPAEDRKARGDADWHFPFRVLSPIEGPAQLLNQPEMEARLEIWLRAAKLPRTSCGRWIFTWNAFQIDCDPQSALKTLEAFDLGPAELHEGLSYRDPKALRAAVLSKGSGADGSILTAEMPLDPDAVRRERAEADVILGEIMHKPTTLEEARRVHAAEAVSGTIATRFEIDRSGRPWRRTRVVNLVITAPDGRTETRTTTETLERKALQEARSRTGG